MIGSRLRAAQHYGRDKIPLVFAPHGARDGALGRVIHRIDCAPRACANALAQHGRAVRRARNTMNPTEFVLTEAHLKLLRRACVGWDDCETGAPAIDPKRPYGSHVAGDVIEILGWPVVYDEEYGGWPEDVEDRAHAIHRETEVALQIVLLHGPVAGTFRKTRPYDRTSWERVEVAPLTAERGEDR